MIEKKYIKVILGVILTILLGAVGSGVWEYVLKPSLGSVSEFILNIATLGIETFKNDIYIQIAKGFSDRTSISILNLINSLLMMAIIVYILTLKDKVFPSEDQDLLKDTSKLSQEESAELLKHYKQLLATGKRKLKKLFIFAVLLLFLLIGIQYMNSFKLGYINKSIVYYQQLKSISQPYISKKELDEINSKFALIKTKNDYVLVISYLEKTLKDNNLEIKKFDVW